MAAGLVVLLDDITALVKLTASSLDGAVVGVAKAGSRAIAVAADNTAITPQYVESIGPKREIPIIGRIAKGSLVNKGIILVGVLLLSAFASQALTPLLMAGDSCLCFEGARRIWDKLTGRGEAQTAVMEGGQAGDAVVKNTMRTDFTLSTEITVIVLIEVTEQNVAYRAVILAVVTVLIIALVYGIVACPVKINNLELHVVPKKSSATWKMGQGFVKAMPKALLAITVVRVAVALWVGGHLLVSGSDKLGRSVSYDVIHSLSSAVPRGFLSRTVETSCLLAAGFVFDSLIVAFQAAVGRVRGDLGH